MLFFFPFHPSPPPPLTKSSQSHISTAQTPNRKLFPDTFFVLILHFSAPTGRIRSAEGLIRGWASAFSPSRSNEANTLTRVTWNVIHFNLAHYSEPLDRSVVFGERGGGFERFHIFLQIFLIFLADRCRLGAPHISHPLRRKPF